MHLYFSTPQVWPLKPKCGLEVGFHFYLNCAIRIFISGPWLEYYVELYAPTSQPKRFN
jgi:hypothetical protein